MIARVVRPPDRPTSPQLRHGQEVAPGGPYSIGVQATASAAPDGRRLEGYAPLRQLSEATLFHAYRNATPDTGEEA